MTTGSPMRATQWGAVPLYCDVPSGETSVAGQPAGETMQPAAEMPGDCTPGHSVLRVAAAMRTPLPSRFRTFFSPCAVSHPATGRTAPLALAAPAAMRPPIHAHTNATLNPLRIRTHLPRAEIACEVSCPRPLGRKRPADQAITLPRASAQELSPGDR